MKNQQSDDYLISDITVNGNNVGSLASNKEFRICYCVVENNLKKNNKKIIGCFINPYDRVLEKSESIDNLVYFFQMYLPINKVFGIRELLKYTSSRNYSKHIVKQILKENVDVTIKKMITKCEDKLKNKY